jgi:hypothetical protein
VISPAEAEQSLSAGPSASARLQLRHLAQFFITLKTTACQCNPEVLKAQTLRKLSKNSSSQPHTYKALVHLVEIFSFENPLIQSSYREPIGLQTRKAA